MAGGADRLGQPPAASDVAWCARRGRRPWSGQPARAASVSAVRSATEPCRVRPDRLRPPGCCCPDRSPPTRQMSRWGGRSCPLVTREQHDRGPDQGTGKSTASSGMPAGRPGVTQPDVGAAAWRPVGDDERLPGRRGHGHTASELRGWRPAHGADHGLLAARAAGSEWSGAIPADWAMCCVPDMSPAYGRSKTAHRCSLQDRGGDQLGTTRPARDCTSPTCRLVGERCRTRLTCREA